MPVNSDSYWLIGIGSTSIAIKASEVAFIAPVADVNAGTGTLSISGQEFPVYAFTDDFHLTRYNPDYFRFCACLVSNRRDIFAIAINSIKQETFGAKTAFYNLPPIMTNPLFDRLVEIYDEVVLLTSSSKIWDQINTELKLSGKTSALLKVS